MTGAYNLAGALVKHPEDPATAFAEYTESMQDVVQRAQKLPLGGPPYGLPHLINPETWWGIWMMRVIVAAMYWSGITKLLILLVRPKPASAVPVREYGFRQLPEWRE